MPQALDRADQFSSELATLVATLRPRILSLADRRLAGHLRPKMDPEDVVQSVLMSFFRRCQLGSITYVGGPALWQLLATMTTRKCINRQTHFRAGRRDVAREVSWEGAEGELPDCPRLSPTPLAAVCFAETWEQMTAGFTVQEREIVLLYLEGYTICEVSELVGRAERTVRRLLGRVRNRLTELLSTTD